MRDLGFLGKRRSGNGFPCLAPRRLVVRRAISDFWEGIRRCSSFRGLVVLAAILGAASLGGCKGGGSSPTDPSNAYAYANWNCNNQQQCIDVIGHNTGSAGPFCSFTACDAWKAQFFQGANCASVNQYQIWNAPSPGSACSNYPN